MCIKTCWQKLHRLSPSAQVALAGVYGLLLSGGAYVLEYGFHALPCHMCWLQRYDHWALTAIGLGGALVLQKRPQWRWAVWLGLLGAALTGVGLAIYHTLIQLKIVPLPEGCEGSSIVIPDDIDAFLASLHHTFIPPACDQADFTILGLTLPMWNIAAMVGLTVGLGVLACWWRKKA